MEIGHYRGAHDSKKSKNVKNELNEFQSSIVNGIGSHGVVLKVLQHILHGKSN